MTPTEALNEFNILYNNIDSNRSPGLDEYEISVLCTKAQEEILKNYLFPVSPGNNLKTGIDDSPKRQMDFSNLIETTTQENIDPESEEANNPLSKTNFFKGQQTFRFEIRDKALCVLNEFCDIDMYPYRATVVPIDFNQYSTISLKPWKYPPKNQVWKMYYTGEQRVALISYAKITKYIIRYVRIPYPCIVGKFMDPELSINGKTVPYNYEESVEGDIINVGHFSELPEELHREIIQRAVELAKGSYDKEEMEYHIKLGERRE